MTIQETCSLLMACCSFGMLILTAINLSIIIAQHVH